MADITVTPQQRGTGILVAVGLLVLVFGVPATLMFGGSGGLSRSNPVWFVAMLIVFAAALALIAIVFRWLQLATPAEAFGLPTGSIRTLLAIGVMVLFTVFGLAAITDGSDVRPADKAMADNVPLGGATLAAEIERYKAMNIAAIPRPDDAGKLTLYRMEHQRPSETVDLLKQIITALVTLVTSVVSFYFGSRSVEAARDGRDGARTLPESVTADVAAVDKELDGLRQRLDAAQASGPATGNEAAYAPALAAATSALTAATERREALAKALAAWPAGGTGEALATQTGTVKQSVSDLRGRVEQLEALAAKG